MCHRLVAQRKTNSLGFGLRFRCEASSDGHGRRTVPLCGGSPHAFPGRLEPGLFGCVQQHFPETFRTAKRGLWARQSGSNSLARGLSQASSSDPTLPCLPSRRCDCMRVCVCGWVWVWVWVWGGTLCDAPVARSKRGRILAWLFMLKRMSV